MGLRTAQVAIGSRDEIACTCCNLVHAFGGTNGSEVGATPRKCHSIMSLGETRARLCGQLSGAGELFDAVLLLATQQHIDRHWQSTEQGHAACMPRLTQLRN
jgi:hypothetical protein